MTETLVGQFPKHIGSTGGLLNSAETEEKYAIVWKSTQEQAFELPTGCLLYTSPSPRDGW